MWWLCGCVSHRKILIDDIYDIMDAKHAEKYGITIERYRRILSLPYMDQGLMDKMHSDGYDFSDTSQDLMLFAEMQTGPETHDQKEKEKEKEKKE